MQSKCFLDKKVLLSSDWEDSYNMQNQLLASEFTPFHSACFVCYEM